MTIHLHILVALEGVEQQWLPVPRPPVSLWSCVRSRHGRDHGGQESWTLDCQPHSGEFAPQIRDLQHSQVCVYMCVCVYVCVCVCVGVCMCMGGCGSLEVTNHSGPQNRQSYRQYLKVKGQEDNCGKYNTHSITQHRLSVKASSIIHTIYAVAPRQ